jgi:hypothetical protein
MAQTKKLWKTTKVHVTAYASLTSCKWLITVILFANTHHVLTLSNEWMKSGGEEMAAIHVSAIFFRWVISLHLEIEA